MININIYECEIIANALIPILELTEQRSITYTTIEKYKKVIESELHKLDMHVRIIPLSNVAKFLSDNYNDVFFTTSENDDLRIFVKKEVSPNFLRKNFNRLMPIHVVKTFTCPKALSVLIDKDSLWKY